ncbi:MAG: cobalamin-dependent protein [Elusimicrobiota bacterium]
MKILLIKPKWFIRSGLYRFLNNIKFTPLHLGIIAALSEREGHEVKVVDADWDEIPYNEKFDLIGITVTTFTSQQVYSIAGKFKEKGAKVIFGGVHPSLLPEECLLLADAVIVGEVEYVWTDILRDMEEGTLKKVYQSNKTVDMDDAPSQKRELLISHGSLEKEFICPGRINIHIQRRINKCPAIFTFLCKSSRRPARAKP